MIIVFIFFVFTGYIFENSIMNDETIILERKDLVKGRGQENIIVHIEHMRFVAYEDAGENFSIVEENGFTFNFLNQRIFIPTSVKLKSKEMNVIKRTLVEHRYERRLRWIQVNRDSKFVNIEGQLFSYCCI